MIHKNEKAMVFHLLSGLDYSKSLDKVLSDFGYDVGDYRFENRTTVIKMKDAVKQMWLLFHDHFDK